MGLSTMSLGQISEKSCEDAKGNSFDPIFMKLCQKSLVGQKN